jgi:hypothetical protein
MQQFTAKVFDQPRLSIQMDSVEEGMLDVQK